ncbi:hypothetical protein U1Q18_024705 [Sarracenia purpurea var. burkii]
MDWLPLMVEVSTFVCFMERWRQLVCWTKNRCWVAISFVWTGACRSKDVISGGSLLRGFGGSVITVLIKVGWVLTALDHVFEPRVMVIGIPDGRSHDEGGGLS